MAAALGFIADDRAPIADRFGFAPVTAVFGFIADDSVPIADGLAPAVPFGRLVML